MTKSWIRPWNKYFISDNKLLYKVMREDDKMFHALVIPSTLSKYICIKHIKTLPYFWILVHILVNSLYSCADYHISILFLFHLSIKSERLGGTAHFFLFLHYFPAFSYVFCELLFGLLVHLVLQTVMTDALSSPILAPGCLLGDTCGNLI